MVGRKNNTRRRASFDGGDSASFHRSRTISGYQPVDDSAAEAVVLERQAELRQSSQHRRSVRILAVVALVVGIIGLLASQLVLNVSSVQYQPASVPDQRQAQYLEFANNYLADHPTQRFLWLLSDSDLLAAARASFPEIATARLVSNLLTGGRLELGLRQPVAVWISGDKRQYVDSSGAVFSTNYFPEPNITITDLNRSSQVNGISSRMLEFIGRTIAGVEASGQGKVTEVSIPAGAARYVELRLADRAFFVKVQIDRDVDSQITDIVNMIKYLDEHAITPSYIDVRVKNRGYYK